ncbi:hypothetical protein ZTR_06339 [Talaromyces verruculosus]|nr:hypothetical protein ZTR_06339 [Talaromyces verruculosus]
MCLRPNTIMTAVNDSEAPAILATGSVFTALSVLAYIFIYGIFYYPAIALTNISILLLYRRISDTGCFKHVASLCLLLIVLQIIWAIPGALVEIWCGVEVAVFVEAETECVRDFYPWELVYPLISPALWMACIGEDSSICSVIITGIIHIVICYRGLGALQLDKDAFWLNIHAGIAIFSACLPTYKPLVSSAKSKISAYGTNNSGSGTGSVADLCAQKGGSRYKESRFIDANPNNRNNGYGRKASAKGWMSMDSVDTLRDEGARDGEEVFRLIGSQSWNWKAMAHMLS